MKTLKQANIQYTILTNFYFEYVKTQSMKKHGGFMQASKSIGKDPSYITKSLERRSLNTLKKISEEL